MRSSRQAAPAACAPQCACRAHELAAGLPIISVHLADQLVQLALVENEVLAVVELGCSVSRRGGSGAGREWKAVTCGHHDPMPVPRRAADLTDEALPASHRHHGLDGARGCAQAANAAHKQQAPLTELAVDVGGHEAMALVCTQG